MKEPEIEETTRSSAIANMTDRRPYVRRPTADAILCARHDQKREISSITKIYKNTTTTK